MTHSPILHTENLSFSVGEKRIVADISIDVYRGEVLALVGPSGAGKSTFLRLLNRLDEPTGGTVFVDEVDYRQITPRDLRQRVGMVLQSPYLFPGTVADNLRFGPSQRGQQVAPETIDSLLARVDLPGYANRDVSRLSGGEAQRVSLARTLANSPEIILLDEPTSALDDASEKDVEALIQGILQAGGLTCLIVTHDMQQAARLADRVMMMDKGCLTKIGTMREVLDVK